MTYDHANADSPRELLNLPTRESYFECESTLAALGSGSNYRVHCKRTLHLPRGACLASELMFELVRPAQFFTFEDICAARRSA
jgi:hypothetical protein